jgi:hypothetical protein
LPTHKLTSICAGHNVDRRTVLVGCFSSPSGPVKDRPCSRARRTSSQTDRPIEDVDFRDIVCWVMDICATEGSGLAVSRGARDRLLGWSLAAAVHQADPCREQSAVLRAGRRIWLLR